MDPADRRVGPVASHEGVDEVGVVLIVVWRTVAHEIGARPPGLKVEAGDELEASRVGGLDNPVSLGPVELALVVVLDIGPAKERPDPAKSERLHPGEVAGRGGRLVVNEHTQAIFGTRRSVGALGSHDRRRRTDQQEARHQHPTGQAAHSDQEYPPVSHVGERRHRRLLTFCFENESGKQMTLQRPRRLACPVTGHVMP